MHSTNTKEIKKALKSWREYTSLNERAATSTDPEAIGYEPGDEESLEGPAGSEEVGGVQLEPQMTLSPVLQFQKDIRSGYETFIYFPDKKTSGLNIRYVPTAGPKASFGQMPGKNLEEGLLDEAGMPGFDDLPRPPRVGGPQPTHVSSFFIRTTNALYKLDMENFAIDLERGKNLEDILEIVPSSRARKIPGLNPSAAAEALEDLAARGKFDLGDPSHKKLLQELKRLGKVMSDIIEPIVEATEDAEDIGKIMRKNIVRTSFESLARAIYEKGDYIRAWYFGDQDAVDRLVRKFTNKRQKMAYREKAIGAYNEKVKRSPTRYTKRELNRKEYATMLKGERAKLEASNKKIDKITKTGYAGFDVPGLRGRDIPGVQTPVAGLESTAVEVPKTEIDPADPHGTKRQKAKEKLKVYEAKRNLNTGKINSIDNILEMLKELPPPKPGASTLGRSASTSKRVVKSVIGAARKTLTTKGGLAGLGLGVATYIVIQEYVADIKPLLGILGDGLLYSIAWTVDADPSGMMADWFIDSLEAAAIVANKKRNSWVDKKDNSDCDEKTFYFSEEEKAIANNNGIELRRALPKRDLCKLDRLLIKSINKYIQNRLVKDTADSTWRAGSMGTDAVIPESNNRNKIKILLG